MSATDALPAHSLSMDDKSLDMVEDTKALRVRAEKARAMSQGLPEADRLRLVSYAEKLDARAAELESTLMNER